MRVRESGEEIYSQREYWAKYQNDAPNFNPGGGSVATPSAPEEAGRYQPLWRDYTEGGLTVDEIPAIQVVVAPTSFRQMRPPHRRQLAHVLEPVHV